MTVYSKMVGKEVVLKLHDASIIRQQYWLAKKQGKTYYEAKWNLEYDCLSEHGLGAVEEYRQVFRLCFDSSPKPAFEDSSFNNIVINDGTGFTESFEFDS